MKDEALLAAQLAQRGTAHALDPILGMRVADALHDLPDIFILMAFRDAVLRRDAALP